MTMASTGAVAFDEQRLHIALEEMSDPELDALDFGVIGFDEVGIVRRYNAFETAAAGLSRPRVVGHALFTIVAPCMNNYLVAQRFDDALANATVLDESIDYVLTLRMRPIAVKLRLLAAAGVPMRYVAVLRRH